MTTPLPKPIAKAAAYSASLFASIALTGCVDSNDRLSVGDALFVEGISPPPFVGVNDAPASPRSNDGPSVVALDRNNWPTRDFAVPFDGTRHRPHYQTDLRLTDDLARQRNEYPTLASSLDLNGDELGDHAWWSRLQEAFVLPLYAAGEGLLILPKLVGEPQSLEEWSPSEPYERSPAWGGLAHDRSKQPFAPPPEDYPDPTKRLNPEDTGGEQVPAEREE